MGQGISAYWDLHPPTTIHDIMWQNDQWLDISWEVAQLLEGLAMHDEFSFVALCSVASSQNPQFCLVPEEGGRCPKMVKYHGFLFSFSERWRPNRGSVSMLLFVAFR